MKEIEVKIRSLGNDQFQSYVQVQKKSGEKSWKDEGPRLQAGGPGWLGDQITETYKIEDDERLIVEVEAVLRRVLDTNQNAVIYAPLDDPDGQQTTAENEEARLKRGEFEAEAARQTGLDKEEREKKHEEREKKYADWEKSMRKRGEEMKKGRAEAASRSTVDTSVEGEKKGETASSRAVSSPQQAGGTQVPPKGGAKDSREVKP